MTRKERNSANGSLNYFASEGLPGHVCKTHRLLKLTDHETYVEMEFTTEKGHIKHWFPHTSHLRQGFPYLFRVHSKAIWAGALWCRKTGVLRQVLGAAGKAVNLGG
jgi:hypothetical protein